MDAMKLIDCHTHTAYSGHGHGTPQESVAAACERGLAVLAATEHWTLPLELDPQRGDSMSPEVAASYVSELEALRAQLAERGADMQLIIGAEVDWLGERFKPEPLDARIEYALGSVHFIDGLPLDNSDDLRLWESLGEEGVWQRYLQEWIAMVASPLRFDAFAHPDLPKVFGSRASQNFAGAYADMACAVAKRGALVEVNTAGWRKAAGEQYPALDLLKAFAQAGVDCTVGSDAHSPQDVGCDIARAYDVMTQAGYTRVAVPEPDGDRHYIDL